MRTIVQRLCVALASALAAAAASAQPCGLAQDFGVGISAPNPLTTAKPWFFAMQVHDDGSGPALYAAGQAIFLGTTSPGSTNQSVVRFRNGRASPLGYYTMGTANTLLSADLGPNLPGGPKLFAGGGSFRASNAPGPEIRNFAMWDGQRWNDVGDPLINPLAMVVFDDGQGAGPQLYAAGSPRSNDLSGQVVSRWNGTTWERLPSLPAVGNSPGVSDLAVFDDGSGPALYAVGSFGDPNSDFSGFAKWNGQAWQILRGPAVGGGLTSIRAFAGKLYAAGPVVLTDGQFGLAVRNPDGSWSGIGNGRLVDGGIGLPTLSIVTEPAGPAMYIGGLGWKFDSNGLHQSSGLLRFDGQHLTFPIAASSSYADPGTANFRDFGNSFGPAAIFNDGNGPELFAGGIFAAVATVADGTTPPSPSAASPARSMVRAPLTGPAAGQLFQTGTGVALTDLQAWNFPQLTMRRVHFDGRDQLAFFGNVHAGGGQVSAGLLLFDGEHWTRDLPARSQYARAAAESTMNGVSGLVLAPAITGNYGYTDFRFISPGSSVAQPLAVPPLSSVSNLLTFDDGTTGGPTFYALTSYSLQRLVSGQWQPLLFGSNTSFGAMIVADLGQGPRLLLGMTFTDTGPGVGMWNGSTFVPLGQAGAFTSVPNGLYMYDDGTGPALYAGFSNSTTIDGQTTSGILRYDGERWRALGRGIVRALYGSQPLAMAGFDDGNGMALYVAGDIFQAGGVPSYGFARWKNNTWEPVLDDGWSNSGPVTRELSLAVLGDTLYLSGYFSDVGWRLPGSSAQQPLGGFSAENLLAIRRCPPACFPDLNHDGAIDQGDVDYLINAAAGGDNPTGANLDLNNDDVVDQSDIDRLIDVVAGGPCQ